ncbi:MAG: flippase-like domain-containing protein [Candidatus Dormibacteraeota bacterium]|nr:flippase-like domain-containing protein [Candidatus Dormibacteraeota bacterium]
MAMRALRSLLRSRIFAVVFGLGFTALLLWRIGPTRVGDSLIRVNLPLMGAAVALNVPVVMLRTWRTHVLLRRLGARVPLWRLVTSGVIGLTLSGITPAAGGDLVRAYLWRRDDEVPVRSGALVVVVERVGSLGLMGLLGLSTFALQVSDWRLRALAAVAWVCLAVPWLVSRLGLGPWALQELGRLPLIRRRAALVERSADDLTLLSEDLVLQGWFLVLSLTIFAISGAQVWLLVIGLGGAVPLVAAIAGYCISQVGGAVSTLPFGVGAGDVLLVVILTQAGLAAHMGAAAAILIRVATTLPIAVAAVVAWALTLPVRRNLSSVDIR